MGLALGNGRLLVGLLESTTAIGLPAPVLAASKRIGEFLVRVSP